MRFSDVPFLRFLLFLLMGILLAGQFEMPESKIMIVILGILWLLYFGLIHLAFHLKNRNLTSSLAYLILFLSGVFLAQIKAERDFKSADPKLVEVEAYLATVNQFDIEKPNSFENLLEVNAAKIDGKWQESNGDILVYHQSPISLRPGEVLLVNGTPELLPDPLNPHEFDYKGFLARKGIFHRQFVGTEFLVIDSADVGSRRYFIANLRQGLGEMLKSRIPHPESRQIASALLIGQKQNLDPDIRAAYVQAGVMHILAVSGLHVGIIYALFIFILKPLRLSKTQSRYFLTMVVLVIWLYAFLTGLSPSVVRASTMFSLLTFGQMRERKPPVFNILAFSAILMITWNPEVIFEVGFQLSYLAVGGIVLIQPLLLKWWLPPNKFWEYVWQLTTVSLAAQLATFPLSIYYFHVFPTYFLLGNLLIIPLAFLIMQVGVPLLFLGWIPGIGELLGWILSWMIRIQNWIAGMIRLIPGGKVDDLSIDGFSIVLVWSLVLIWSAWEFGKKKNLVFLSLILFGLWSGVKGYKAYVKPTEQLVFYKGRTGILIDYVAYTSTFSWNEGLEPSEINYLVKPNRILSGFSSIPKSLKMIEKEGQLSFFPGNFSFDTSSEKVYFSDRRPQSIQVWESGAWQNRKVRDSIEIKKRAIRAIF